MSTADLATATTVPLHDLLAHRWSPRGYDPHAVIPGPELNAILEAARWAPSARNLQPRRFLVHRRGEAAYDRIVAHLAPGNQTWAGDASVLIVAVAEITAADGSPQRWARYDLGQAVAHLSVQAQAFGIDVRQMGGIDAAGLAGEFGFPDRFEAVTVIAVGYRDGRAVPPSRERLSLDELVNPQTWD